MWVLERSHRTEDEFLERNDGDEVRTKQVGIDGVAVVTAGKERRRLVEIGLTFRNQALSARHTVCETRRSSLVVRKTRVDDALAYQRLDAPDEQIVRHGAVPEPSPS